MREKLLGEFTSTGCKDSWKLLMFATKYKSHLPWLSGAARLAVQSCGLAISPAGRVRRGKTLLLSGRCRDSEAP